MIKGSKICGVSDLETLNFIINHPYPPKFIGFICNYKKSPRYVEIEKLSELITVDKKNQILLQYWSNQMKIFLKKLNICLSITIKFTTALRKKSE